MPLQAQKSLEIGTLQIKNDPFKDLSNFSHDEVPEEATKKARNIAKFLDFLDIK